MTQNEILNGQLTPEELEQFKPLLTKIRPTVESKLSNFESAANDWQAKAKEKDDWYNNTALPTLDKEMKARQDAEAKAAAYEAKLKTMAAQGLTNFEEPAVPPPAPNASPANGDWISKKEFDAQSLKFAQMQGKAMARFASISNEHHVLFGQPLTDFEALYEEAITKQRNIADVWQEKYNVTAKKAEIEAKKIADNEARIRADERTKILSAQGNPNTRDAWPSQNSFIPKPTSGDSKMPWEKPGGGREERLRAAFQAQAQRGVQ